MFKINHALLLAGMLPVLFTLLTACQQDKNKIADTVLDGTEAIDLSNTTIEPISAEQLGLPAHPDIVVIVSDDQGYADIGAQGIVSDIKTPNIDAMAQAGVRMTSAYVTAPQCAPSRAGIMTGQYQQRFGLDNNDRLPLPLGIWSLETGSSKVSTVGDRIKKLGYQTGQVGKWHLNIDGEPRYMPNHRGFDWCYTGYIYNFWSTFDMAGNMLDEQDVPAEKYRVDAVTQAAITFIDHASDKPFLLFVDYYAPHVPLQAPDRYLNRFPVTLPQARRLGLAMMYAIDSGVGDIVQALKNNNRYDNSLIIYVSDNGASHTLALNQAGGRPSLNTPLKGEKFMLSEGGIRVPFIMQWPNVLPANTVFEHPVSALDIARTALYAAGDPTLHGLNGVNLDGVNLFDYIAHPETYGERSLFWRFHSQSAVRKGHWKYLSVANGQFEFLYDLSQDAGEKNNLSGQYPLEVAQLKSELAMWEKQLPPSQDTAIRPEEKNLYKYYYGLQL